MVKPEEKLIIMIDEVQDNLTDLDNSIKIILESCKKEIEDGYKLKDQDILIINRLWSTRNKEKRRCNFCNTDTYTQDEDCVDCGFLKTGRSRR